MAKKGKYVSLIERIFLDKYKKGDSEVPFQRDDIISYAQKLNISVPKNIGDVILLILPRSLLGFKLNQYTTPKNTVV